MHGAFRAVIEVPGKVTARFGQLGKGDHRPCGPMEKSATTKAIAGCLWFRLIGTTLCSRFGISAARSCLSRRRADPTPSPAHRSSPRHTSVACRGYPRMRRKGMTSVWFLQPDPQRGARSVGTAHAGRHRRIPRHDLAQRRRANHPRVGQDAAHRRGRRAPIRRRKRPQLATSGARRSCSTDTPGRSPVASVPACWSSRRRPSRARSRMWRRSFRDDRPHNPR